MLAHRVIPTLLCRGRQLIKGSRFASWRSVGVAAQAVRIHQARGVDELMLLDIAATAEGRGPDLALVRELSEACFMPLSVGGGVRSVEDARALLEAGADKVVVGTGGPRVIYEIAKRVGCQAVAASVDVRDGVAWVQSGTMRTGMPALQWAKECAYHGAGEIVLTSIDREGTLQGYDIELVRAVADAVDVPVIAHGGAGNYEHMLEAIRAGASAVAAGAMFQFTDATPAGAARYLQENGVEARV